MLERGDTCHATGRTYAELDHFNIGTAQNDEWKPFVSEEIYRDWMFGKGRPVPKHPLLLHPTSEKGGE